MSSLIDPTFDFKGGSYYADLLVSEIFLSDMIVGIFWADFFENRCSERSSFLTLGKLSCFLSIILGGNSFFRSTNTLDFYI